MVLEKTLESALDYKEIQPVHSEGDQPWDFFGRNNAEAATPVFLPGESQGRESLAGCSLWGSQSQTRLKRLSSSSSSNTTKAETPILWPPHVKSWFIGKDSNAGRDWEHEEKGTTEDKMVGWHHRLNGHEFE